MWWQQELNEMILVYNKFLYLKISVEGMRIYIIDVLKKTHAYYRLPAKKLKKTKRKTEMMRSYSPHVLLGAQACASSFWASIPTHTHFESPHA